MPSGTGPEKIGTLVFDLPGEKVNKLNHRVMNDLRAVLPELERLGKEGALDALILVSGKSRNFVAGADIEMIRATKTVEEAEALALAGDEVANRWEDLPFPTIAAVDGAALGGGFELALSCSAIVMSDDPGARVGFPEVMLGLIPGMGGCVRLPRKGGLATALDLILTGKTLNGERAFRSGLVEACVPRQDFVSSVRRWVIANLKSLKEGRRIARDPKLGGMGGLAGSLLEGTPMGRQVIFRKAKDGVLSKTRGKYPAPLEALKVLRGTFAGFGPKLRGEARDRALRLEAKAFGRLAATEVSRNLIRIYTLTEGVKKSKGLPAGVAAEALPIASGAVLGAGVMGGGIAQLFAEKGVPVRMKDLNVQALTLGIQAANRLFQRQVQKKRITKRQSLQRLNLIAPVLDYAGFEKADVVIEAVIEKMDIKQKVLQEVENHVPGRCVLASNTSSLSISIMQSALKRPERFVGMHFFNPVDRMPLIEVIRGDRTSDEAVSTIYQFSKQLGKTPIVVKDAPGFLVNRLLVPYLNEASYLLAEGVPIPELDEAMLDFGMPMGPMELMDEVGIDVGEKVLHILHEAFGARMTPAPDMSKVVAAGRLGKKAGKGLYVYGKDRRKRLDPEIYRILGTTPHAGAVSAEEIVDRCVLPMINEAARCLQEGVVASPSEVDLGMIMGTGFPPFRGGLLRYADTLGPKTLVERLRKYEKRFGARFEPSPALLERAEHDLRFYPA
ncbi:MAG: 3-hydroxyacyl-CoA dehydrogenase NAD-binding domain-containing protein [Oligoflexia bacterium]|nr:3-hydroxyacyl-CoA dehydrogenase NAD-binding domain-containing protein [Oligoflexia bacterium]